MFHVVRMPILRAIQYEPRVLRLRQVSITEMLQSQNIPTGYEQP